MKFLALTKYGDRAASARQRLLQYRPFFSEAGVDFACLPLLDNAYLDQNFGGKRAPIMRTAGAYFGRMASLLLRRDFDALWIQYELFPYFPGAVENLSRVVGKPVICDYDDAIFHQYDKHTNRLVRVMLGRKLQPLMRVSNLCICGNAYIRAYADRFCRRTELVPTVLDTSDYVPSRAPRRDAQTVTIGWIGSPSTWTFVRPFVPLLKRLAGELNLTIRVVGARRPQVVPPRFEFLDWSDETEVEFIQGMDIGIMPLPDEPWARGKCGYKLIQYMACGLPVIASPVGVNAEIVDDGVNGFLARTDRDWIEAIRRLACDARLRREMGAHGRAQIERAYSLQVHGPRLAGILREVVERVRR